MFSAIQCVIILVASGAAIIIALGYPDRYRIEEETAGNDNTRLSWMMKNFQYSIACFSLTLIGLMIAVDEVV